MLIYLFIKHFFLTIIYNLRITLTIVDGGGHRATAREPVRRQDMIMKVTVVAMKSSQILEYFDGRANRICDELDMQYERTESRISQRFFIYATGKNRISIS